MSAGFINLGALLNIDLDSKATITATAIGALAVQSAAASYTHAATTFTTASTVFNAGTLFDVNAVAITLN